MTGIHIRHTIRIHEKDEPDLYAELSNQRTNNASIKRLLSLAKLGLITERMYLQAGVGVSSFPALVPAQANAPATQPAPSNKEADPSPKSKPAQETKPSQSPKAAKKGKENGPTKISVKPISMDDDFDAGALSDFFDGPMGGGVT
jgi:hypothetical protein